MSKEAMRPRLLERLISRVVPVFTYIFVSLRIRATTPQALGLIASDAAADRDILTRYPSTLLRDQQQDGIRNIMRPTSPILHPGVRPQAIIIFLHEFRCQDVGVRVSRSDGVDRDVLPSSSELVCESQSQFFGKRFNPPPPSSN